jgi:DNA-binding XRE family transcriptional regulator
MPLSHSRMTLIDEVRAGRLPPPEKRREIRLRAKVSQVRMARELGVHRLTLIHWEEGSHEPTAEHRLRYAQLLAQLRRAA